MSKFYLKCCYLSLFMLLSITTIFAQQSVTGTVSDANGVVPGVTVAVPGTTRGTQTDADGKYTIPASNGEKLRFSMIGYTSQELTVSSTTHNITLREDAGSLDEVVVTAMGIKREKKSLGYAFQDVKGDQLVDAKENNISNALVGKVSGLQVVKGSNGPASSSKIILRGFNSLKGDNQPLIVVDGIPMNNRAGNPDKNNDFWNPSTDLGNGLGDLNPEDIESMSVLKGGAAAALYGSRGGNGVIVITTKSGKAQKGSGITYSSTLGIETLFMVPELQNDFGQGTDGSFVNTQFNSWGAKIEGQTVTNWNGQNTTLRSHDNIGNFFGTGINHTQNITFQQQLNNNTNLYTSATYLNDNSLIPGSSMSRLNLLTRVTTNFGENKKWSSDVKAQYMNIDAKNRPIAGQNQSNMYNSLFLFPRSLDITEFEAATEGNGNMLWFGNGNEVNPYWIEKYRLNNDKRDRFLLSGSLKYDFNEWLNAEAKLGSDIYYTTIDNRTYAGSPLTDDGEGSYSFGNNNFYENNYMFSLNARKDNLWGKWGGAASLFGQIMTTKSEYRTTEIGQLIIPNVFNPNNGISNPNIKTTPSEKQINSIFATAELNYDGVWFLNLTGRNDWSSALSKENRSFFYPSINTSLIVTDLLSKSGSSLPSWWSFGKIRASYAAVGNDLDPFQLYNTYKLEKDPNGNTVTTREDVMYNEDIKSELIKTYEAGIEARFFNSRIGLDFTWYKTNATNQIIDVPMDAFSGYQRQFINAGNIENKGIEISLNARILESSEKLNWNIDVNFSKNRNRIIELSDVTKTYNLLALENISIRADEGYDYGEIYGSAYSRVEDPDSEYFGKMIVAANGLPTEGPSTFLGKQNPSALLGITNSFSYKNFGLSFLVDGRFGGKFFSGTNAVLQQFGVAAATVNNGNRDRFVVDGVVSNGSGGYDVNTVEVNPQQYWAAIGNPNLGITERNMYDATNVRLRNVSLSYSLPSSVLKNSVVQRAKIGLTANNVWMIKSYANGVDPESVFAISSNAVGFENFSTPTARSYFLNLTIGF
ncbi:SusC/RagA family TonB-linked outer membrane protein [Sphingobacterium pedocola]|uniref:SusC/RagA family TonB-linked outer membrane protein n=1 Tax=Sphingobacterium pedocola TaxID=2082722 RepID=A0ABR9T4Q3_9SPHI|nr:SusC/RagA family TonB-linked outer membrane protein [Sphingobacterium pedocola]MBE8719982.1 SusC/RagA family TonB-linked outer membrane protein [Sphingobacterium pedocola]